MNIRTFFAVLAMDKIPLWGAFAISVATGAVVAGFVRAFLVSYYQKKLSATPVNFTLGLSNGKKES